MGRKKKTGLADKPLNIRLYEQDYVEIKGIAKKLEVSDSDVHRELVAEALQTRRSQKNSEPEMNPDKASLMSLLRRIEQALAEGKNSSAPALCDDVQTLASRVEFLSGQIAVLINSRL